MAEATRMANPLFSLDRMTNALNVTAIARSPKALSVEVLHSPNPTTLRSNCLAL